MKIFMIIILLNLLIGCGNDSGNKDNINLAPIITGTFIDSPVKGMKYVTDTISGVTDEDGSYKCRNSERIYFKIGETTIGSAICQSRLTPYELLEETPSSNTKVKRMVKMFLSLDVDNNPDNGIDVTGISISHGGIIDFSDDIDYQNVLIDLAKTDVGDAAATTHIETYTNKAHTIYDGTYTGIMTVQTGSCVNTDFTVIITNAKITYVEVIFDDLKLNEIITERVNVRGSPFWPYADSVMQGLIDLKTSDDPYCDTKGGSKLEVFRFSNADIRHDTGYYFSGIATKSVLCNNEHSTNNCEFNLKVYRQEEL